MIDHVCFSTWVPLDQPAGVDLMNLNRLTPGLMEGSAVSASHKAVIEIPLLLSADQLEEIEKLAHVQGLTTGEMVRQVLRAFLTTSSPASSCCAGAPAP